MWKLIDEDEAYLSGVAGADGTGELKLVPPGRMYKRRIGRIKLYSDSALVPLVDIYKGAVQPENAVDHSEDGRDDTSLNHPPILQKGTEPIIIRFTGATAGARIVARVQFELVEFVR